MSSAVSVSPNRNVHSARAAGGKDVLGGKDILQIPGPTGAHRLSGASRSRPAAVTFRQECLRVWATRTEKESREHQDRSRRGRVPGRTAGPLVAMNTHGFVTERSPRCVARPLSAQCGLQ
jgi:hypothetical protein